ncbi:Heat stress transcription factor A-8 [Heracleum sosnowskyi]|uniref:Heat stress transcription factor A-8 n=1 Tax=Heracleum sosnowskyi TaxID=360622 RepID=A0AAD8MZ44_9APIA|nr:Heat stress transcription factor A-8 [Heracleum sosnowskyi]
MVRKVADDVAPFLLKCYEMVEDETSDKLISWGSNNDSFVIWDEVDFSSHLLPKYFKHNTFSSFVRQLNIYGFRKIETDRYEFANDWFIKGEKHLLKNIVRRKNINNELQSKPSQKQMKDVAVQKEEKKAGLWKEVESLKTDKNMLMQELVKLSQHQQTSQTKMLVVREQLKGMEKNQQQMLSFIVMAMQSPGFLVKLLQPKDNNWHVPESGKTVLEEVTEDQEIVASDGMIVRYQPPMVESGSFDGDFTGLENQGSLNLSDLPLEDDMDRLLLSDPFLEDGNVGFDIGAEEYQNNLMEMSRS